MNSGSTESFFSCAFFFLKSQLRPSVLLNLTLYFCQTDSMNTEKKRTRTFKQSWKRCLSAAPCRWAAQTLVQHLKHKKLSFKNLTLTQRDERSWFPPWQRDKVHKTHKWPKNLSLFPQTPKAKQTEQQIWVLWIPVSFHNLLCQRHLLYKDL